MASESSRAWYSREMALNWLLRSSDAEELTPEAMAKLKAELSTQNHGLDNLEVLGCYHYGYRYHPAMEVPGHTQPFHMRTPMHCQAWCRATPGCDNFAFWLDNHECWLGGKDAVLVMAKSFGALAGPATCPTEDPPESCTEIPSFLFPAPSRNQTQSAWASGMQPTNLQCWPRKASGFPANCSGQEVRILEDTETGWPGQCDGLKLTDLQAGECQIRCMHNPLCAVWQTKGSPASCYHGMFGTNCYQTTGEKPLRAQRLMHGDFRVLMNAAGIQIMGLQKAFDVTVFPVIQDAEAHCRMICVSYLLCQYWQYSNVYGCWIEDVRVERIAYPLVNDGVNLRTNSAGAATVTAGEFVQHTCKQGPPVPLPLDEPTVTITTTTSSKEQLAAPVPAPAPSAAPPAAEFRGTRTTAPVLTGGTQVEVENSEGLSAGDKIRLTYGEYTEGATVQSVDPKVIYLSGGLQHGYPYPAMVTTDKGLCYNTAGAAKDKLGTGCGFYTENPDSCPSGKSDDANDDSDFTASLMCCECGGGSSQVPREAPSDAGPAPAPPPPLVIDRGGPVSVASGGASLGAPEVNPDMAILGFLVLLVLLCLGCIVYAYVVAFERRKYNSSRELLVAGAAAGDGHSSASPSPSPSPPGSPQAHAAPTQVMQQPAPQYGVPFPHMPQQLYGGPLGGQNQYWGQQPMPNYYG